MDTDSLYLAIAHENLYDCIRPAKKEEWENLRGKDLDDSFRANASHNFLRRTCCSKPKKHDKRARTLQRRIQMHRNDLSLQ